MKTCPFCRAAVPDDARTCPQCGKSIDDAAPAAGPQGDAPAAPNPQPEAAAPEAAVKEEVASAVAEPRTEATGEAAPSACPQCQAPWPAGAVVCTACGYDSRVGRRLSTVHGVEEPPRRVPEIKGSGPARTGLFLHLSRACLFLVVVVLALLLGVLDVQINSIPGLPTAPTRILGDAPPDLAQELTADPTADEGPGRPPRVAAFLLLWIILGFNILMSVMGLLGSVLCLWVPRASGARIWILASLALDVVAGPAAVGLALLGWPVELASLLPLASWLLFMLFLWKLAAYLDRAEEAREAVGILVQGLIVLVAFPTLLLLLPPVLLVPLLMSSEFLGSMGYLLLFAASVVWLVYAVKVLLSLFRLIGTLREALVVKA